MHNRTGIRHRAGLRIANPATPGPTAWDKLSDQWAAVVRPPTAMVKSYGSSGDIWDLLRFGSPTALLSKGLITPEQFSTLIQGQASAEDPLPRYGEKRQELIEGPLPIQPLEDASVEFMSEFALDPLNLVGMGSIAAGVKGARSFLGRVFGVGQNIYSNNPRAAHLKLIGDLEKQVSEGKKNIARLDKNTGEIVVDISYLRSPNRHKDYIDKQAMEYAGFWDYLDKHKREGRKTLSLFEVEDFWAQNNLDIRETWHSQYDDQFSLEGGTNQRSVVITYHGRQPPMSAEMVQNLDNIAQLEYKKSFVDLSPEEQRVLETDYHRWYPGGAIESQGHKITTKFKDRNTQLHHGSENVLFHLRMDDRVGVGKQSGQKILNVFEIQSDWYQRVNREGMYDLEFYDVEKGKLNHEIELLEEQIRDRSIFKPMPVEDIAGIRAKQQANRTKIDELSEQQEIVAGQLRDESAAPKAPFMTPGKGEQWVELALKRILKMAVDGGYDRVTFGSREIQGKIYGQIRPVSYFKVKKMKPSDDIILPKKRLTKEGTVLHPTTEVKGKDYPYYLEAFDVNGNKIEHPEGPSRTIHHFSEGKLVNMFGRSVANKIIAKAKDGRKRKVTGWDEQMMEPGPPYDPPKIIDETPNMGLENLGVLYDITIPSLLKKPPFKDFGMKLEKIPMGMAVTPSELRAADQQFDIDENFLRRNNIELNDNWEQPEFFYNDVDGNRVSVDIEGLENALDGGDITDPPGGLNIPAIMTAARNTHNRLTDGTQGSLQNLGPPDRTQFQVPETGRTQTPEVGEIVGDRPGGLITPQELVNPGGFESRLDRYQHPMHRDRAGADARSLLEDNGITFNETENGVTFNVAENSPLAYARQDIYGSSWEYLQEYRRAGGHPTVIPEEVKLMREIEIANAIEYGITGLDTPPIVDRQYINLMNPETRAVELSHIETDLQSYGIRLYPGPTPADRPRFGIFEETMGYDDAVSADDLESLVPGFGNDVRLYNLARRYEIAGSHRVDPNEVLDTVRAEVMPFHIEQDLDGNLPFTHEEWLANHATDPVEEPGLLDVTPADEGEAGLLAEIQSETPQLPATVGNAGRPFEEVRQQVLASWNDNPSVINARNVLEEMGIQTYIHSEGPPYISFGIWDDNNLPGHQPFWRGINEFTQALDEGIVQPAVNTDELENAARHYAGVIHDRVGPSQQSVVPDPIGLTGEAIGDRIASTFNNDPQIVEYREWLADEGIRIAWHSEPPYLSFSTDDLIMRATDDLDPTETVDGMPLRYRGAEEFLRAMERDEVGPNFSDVVESGMIDSMGDRILDMETRINRSVGDTDIEYTGLQTGQQALPAPAGTQTRIALADVNWMDVASNDIHSDSHRIFQSISPSAQEDLIDMREMADALNTEEFGYIRVEYGSLDEPTFYVGDDSYTAREVIELDWHDLDSDQVAALDHTVQELHETQLRFERTLEETAENGTHLDLEVIAPAETIPAAGLLEDTPEFTERAIRDNPMQWSLKLTDKAKRLLKNPPAYALIPPGILAGEAARQQGQQQSISDENIW